MPIKLQVRRGTAAQWAQAGVGDVVVLLSGEIGFESDTGNVKIGDGTLVWNALPYQFPVVKNARGLDTTTLVIDQTTDFVGMGTDSPSNKLHIEGTAPIVRMRDSASPGTTHVLIDADNADGSLTISADPGASGTAATKINLATDGTTRATIDENGRLGLGTTSPSTALHIVNDVPRIRVTDSAAPTIYSEISGDNTVGHLLVGADEGSTGSTPSLFLRVRGANVMQLAQAGVTVAAGYPLTVNAWANNTIPTNAINAGAVTTAKIGTDVGFQIIEERLAATVGAPGWTVPANVFRIEVLMVGGGGGCIIDFSTSLVRQYLGGHGAMAYCVFDVVPGSTSGAITIGSGGTSNTTAGSVTAGTATTFAGASCGGGLAQTTTANARPAIPAFSAGTQPTGFTLVSNNPGPYSMGYPVRGYSTSNYGFSGSVTNVAGSAWSFTTDPTIALTAGLTNASYAYNTLPNNPLVDARPGIGAAGQCFHNATNVYMCGGGVGGAVIIRYVVKD